MQQQTELGRRLINLLIIKRIIQNRYPEALLLLKNVWNPELKQLVSINSYLINWLQKIGENLMNFDCSNAKDLSLRADFGIF